MTYEIQDSQLRGFWKDFLNSQKGTEIVIVPLLPKHVAGSGCDSNSYCHLATSPLRMSTLRVEESRDG